MKAKTISIILLTFLLNGCSTFGLIFDNLPWMTTWRLDRMFDLNDEQEAYAEQGAERFQHWLKQESFPAIVSRLKQARDLWRDGQHETAFEYFDEAREQTTSEFLVAVSVELTPLLIMLDQENAEHYREYIRENSKDWFDYAESQDDKTESRVERLERWFGDLNKQQVAEVEAIAELLPNEREIRVKNNAYWVDIVLAEALDGNAYFLNEWMKDPSIVWLDSYSELRATNNEQMQQLVAMMIRTMDAEQEANVQEYLEDWIEILEDLI